MRLLYKEKAQARVTGLRLIEALPGESGRKGGIKRVSKCDSEAAAKDLYGFMKQARQGISAVSGHPRIVEIAVDGARGFEGMSAVGYNQVFYDGVHGRNSGGFTFWLYVYPEVGINGSSNFQIIRRHYLVKNVTKL